MRDEFLWDVLPGGAAMAARADAGQVGHPPGAGVGGGEAGGGRGHFRLAPRKASAGEICCVLCLPCQAPIANPPARGNNELLYDVTQNSLKNACGKRRGPSKEVEPRTRRGRTTCAESAPPPPPPCAIPFTEARPEPPSPTLRWGGRTQAQKPPAEARSFHFQGKVDAATCFLRNR